MPQRRVVSVRVRILAAILAVTALGLLAAGGVAYLLQHGRDVAAVDDQLRQQLDEVRLVVEGGGADAAVGGTVPDALPPSPGFTTTAALAYELVRSVSPAMHGSTVAIVEGRASYLPGVGTAFTLDDSTFVREVTAATADGGTVLGTADVAGASLRYLAVPIAVAGDPGQAVFVSAIDLERRLADLRGVMTVYAWVAAAALVVVGLVGWFVAGRLLAPVRDLRETAARISATDLGERIPVAGNDDLSVLTRTINGMIERLEGSFQAQQRLLDDVRHELSTPVTIVRGHLELLDARDTADVEQTRAIALDELDRMTGLIADIAALADAERAVLHPAPVEVGALTRDVFDKARVLSQHSWRLGEVAAGEALLDSARITQAWLQLAENAAKYSPAGTTVELGSRLEGRTLELWVHDEGPGIPREARRRIFERFGRVDDGRGISGSGLGLSIVHAIAEAHAGRVELDSVPARGTRFTIVLPADGVVEGTGG